MACNPPPPFARWRHLLLAATLCLAGAAVADGQPEDRVKAGFVCNFIKYAEWPARAPADAILLCSLGSAPLSGELSRLQGLQAQGRKIQVQLATPKSEWRNCQVLFVPASEQGQITEVLRTLAQAPVLTVSDSTDFAQAGGIIGLKWTVGRIRFVINLAAARRAGLNLNSALLRLAEEVHQ